MKMRANRSRPSGCCPRRGSDRSCRRPRCSILRANPDRAYLRGRPNERVKSGERARHVVAPACELAPTVVREGDAPGPAKRADVHCRSLRRPLHGVQRAGRGVGIARRLHGPVDVGRRTARSAERTEVDLRSFRGLHDRMPPSRRGPCLAHDVPPIVDGGGPTVFPSQGAQVRHPCVGRPKECMPRPGSDLAPAHYLSSVVDAGAKAPLATEGAEIDDSDRSSASYRRDVGSRCLQEQGVGR